jgi:putative transcriptional regulator
MDIHQKIRAFRQEAGLTQVQFAEKLGITQGLVAHYETQPGEIGKNGKEKKSSKPELEKLPLIAEILGKNVIDLFDDEETSKKQIVKKELKNNFEKYAHLIPAEYSLKNVVFLSKSEMRVGAGSEGTFDLEMLNKEERKVAVDKSFVKGLNPVNLRVFEVVGDSMLPDFEESDWAIVDMVNNRGNFVRIAGVYVVRMGEIVYIKRVEFLPNDNVKLISLNPKYGDIYPHKEGYDCEILGKVCGKIHYEVHKGLTFDNFGIK